jgi:hypothetical protein
MAKQKKRAKPQSKRRGRLRRSSWAARSRKASKSVRRAKPKRSVKKAARKKQRPMKSPSREVETVVVDVIEEPVPGVITVTEFEETQIPGRGWVETKGEHKS